MSQFEVFLQGMAFNCNNDRCSKPITYDANFCYSGDDWEAIYRKCVEATLPDDCDFEYSASQSFCFNDSTKPLTDTAPVAISRKNGICLIEFPFCENMIGKECASNNRHMLNLWRYGNEATCTDLKGAQHTMVCSRDSISSGGWIYK